MIKNDNRLKEVLNNQNDFFGFFLGVKRASKKGMKGMYQYSGVCNENIINELKVWDTYSFCDTKLLDRNIM